MKLPKFGLASLFFFLSFGMFLEYLNFLEAPFYTQDAFLRKFWGLAHAHGTLTCFLATFYEILLERLNLQSRLKQIANVLAHTGSICLPFGFLLGVIGHQAGQPGLMILLTPFGGTCLGTALLIPVLCFQPSTARPSLTPS